MVFLLTAALLCILSSTTAQNTDQYENVALRGHAAQSTIYSHLTNAINAIDGNPNSNFHHGSCSCTNYEASPWWRVDLLRPYKISHITITNRGDCCGERLNGADILIGDTLENNGNNNPSCSKVTVIPKVTNQTFQCNGMTGRYVNIYLRQKNTYLQLCEVAVFTESVSNDHLCF